MALLLAASFYAVFIVFTASIDLGVLAHLSGEAMPWGVRLMIPFFNAFGTVVLVGGVIYSAWVFWKRWLMPNWVVFNVLIAVGVILPALGGTLVRFGVSSSTAHALFILLGVVVIFIGFLRSREVFGLYRFPLVHGFRKISTD